MDYGELYRIFISQGLSAALDAASLEFEETETIELLRNLRNSEIEAQFHCNRHEAIKRVTKEFLARRERHS